MRNIITTLSGLVILMLGFPAFSLHAEDWSKELQDRAKRAALHDRAERVRGDSGKWSDEARLQHAPSIDQKPAKLSLDAWGDNLAESPVEVTDKHDNWLILRPRQLDDNDRVWVERIERRGRQITIVANRARWQGKYFRNFTYYPVIGLNLGKLEPGKYDVKWIMQPLVFTRFEGDGKPLDGNWPADERPLDKKPVELQFVINVSSSLPPDADSPRTLRPGP